MMFWGRGDPRRVLVMSGWVVFALCVLALILLMPRE